MPPIEFQLVYDDKTLASVAFNYSVPSLQGTNYVSKYIRYYYSLRVMVIASAP